MLLFSFFFQSLLYTVKLILTSEVGIFMYFLPLNVALDICEVIVFLTFN